jgi:hypothetical protein
MGAIKNLFKLKSNIDVKSNNEIEDTIEAREQVRFTYYQSGYGASSKANGDPTTLSTCLLNLFNSFENLCRKQLNEQKLLKQPYREEQEREKTELRKRETALSIYSEQILALESNIDEHKFQMVDVKS